MRKLLLALIGALLWTAPAAAAGFFSSTGTGVIDPNNSSQLGINSYATPDTMLVDVNAFMLPTPGFPPPPVCGDFDCARPDGLWTLKLSFAEVPLGARYAQTSNGFLNCSPIEACGAYGDGQNVFFDQAICPCTELPTPTGNAVGESFIQKVTINDASGPGFVFVWSNWTADDLLLETTLPLSANGQTFSWTLTLSQPVPEPSEWALLLAGLAMLAVALRTRRRLVA
jgi:hypothetical protein